METKIDTEIILSVMVITMAVLSIILIIISFSHNTIVCYQQNNSGSVTDNTFKFINRAYVIDCSNMAEIYEGLNTSKIYIHIQ